MHNSISALLAPKASEILQGKKIKQIFQVSFPGGSATGFIFAPLGSFHFTLPGRRALVSQYLSLSFCPFLNFVKRSCFHPELPRRWDMGTLVKISARMTRRTYQMNESGRSEPHTEEYAGKLSKANAVGSAQQTQIL